MKTLRILAIAISIVTLSFTTYATEFVELALPNSNKIVVKFMFTNGSITDPAGKQGLTSLTTQLVSGGGTEKLTSTEIGDILYPMAAEIRSSVDKEVSVFTFEVHKDHLEAFYPLMMDLLTKPRFDKNDFDRTKSNQSNYVEQVIRASSDEEYSKKSLEDLLFRGTNYQHMVEGTVSGVKSITLEDAIKHYKSVYTQGNLTVGIAGSYTDKQLNRLKEDIKKLPVGVKKIAKAGLARTPNGINVEIISKKGAMGSAIFTGFPLAVTRADDDFAALMVANSWMGEHRKSYSRLYQKIREARSMNYGDYTYIEWYENGGSNMLPVAGVPRSSNYFSVWLRPVQTASGLKKQYTELSNIEVGHAHFALRMALKEIQSFIDNGMSQEDFELTRKFLRSYIKLYVQTPEKQLGFLMDSKFYGRTNYIEEMDNLLAKVTVEQVNAAIKKYWQTNNMFVSIVTAESEAKALANSLRNNTDSPMSYANSLKETLPDNILKEDDEVAKYKINVKTVKIVDSDSTFQ